MNKRILATALAAVASLGLAAGPAMAGEKPGKAHDKRWVCKMVGKPGVDERLKAGKNPISVSSSATVGTYFKDGQYRSYVLAVDNGGPAPAASQCPPGDDGPDPTPTTPKPDPTKTPKPDPTTTTPTPDPTTSTPTPDPTTTTTTPDPDPTPTEDPELPTPDPSAPWVEGYAMCDGGPSTADHTSVVTNMTVPADGEATTFSLVVPELELAHSETVQPGETIPLMFDLLPGQTANVRVGVAGEVIYEQEFIGYCTAAETPDPETPVVPEVPVVPLDPATTGTGTTDPASAIPSSADELAHTGSNAAWGIGIGVALLLAGFVSWYGARLRSIERQH